MRTRLYGIALGSLLVATLPATGFAADEPVAVVNGKPITLKTYEFFLRQLQAERPNANLAGNRQLVINELVNRELIYQDAVKKKLDKDPEVAFALEQLRKNTMIQANVGKVANGVDISDAKLKKEYDEKIATADVSEYKARHILLKTEADAKAVIKELDGGAVFSDVAKAKSTGPTGPEGGDLGWFKAGQMVPPFAQALAKMKKGTYSNQPVQTQFGWHVILLEDTRKATPPKFEDVKPQLANMIRGQQVNAYIENLRKKAKVEIK
ncbi:MAG: peptidylprolyl isomerase [Gammaproteobacteria bacterium]|nr:peptidylprolyl isomerase [Gammaproteobacteria bacterium]